MTPTPPSLEQIKAEVLPMLLRELTLIQSAHGFIFTPRQRNAMLRHADTMRATELEQSPPGDGGTCGKKTAQQLAAESARNKAAPLRSVVLSATPEPAAFDAEKFILDRCHPNSMPEPFPKVCLLVEAARAQGLRERMPEEMPREFPDILKKYSPAGVWTWLRDKLEGK